MAGKTQTGSEHPRLGAFLTMAVGIILFFGMVSRIHDIPGVAQSEREQKEDETDRLRRQLAEERQRALVVFGRRDPTAEFDNLNQSLESLPGMQDETEPDMPAEQPETAPVEETRPEPDPEPRHQQPEPAPEKRYHVVKPGETLWRIATEVYGDGNQYRRIVDANPTLNPNQLSVGDILVIPTGRPIGRSAGLQ